MANKLKLPIATVIGENALNEAEDILFKLGKSAFIVAGKSMIRQGHINSLTMILEKNGISVTIFSEISNEPTDEDINKGITLYRKHNADFIIGFGGGSQLDAAKAIGILVNNPAPISNYMGKEIPNNLPPLVEIPSTAGTGSEATPFTIITDTKTQVKMLLKGDMLMPTLAIIDPLFSSKTPRSISVCTGLDALTHAIEAFTSKKAFSESDIFAISAIRRIFTYLPKVLVDDDDISAREQMAIAAYEAGVSFSNSSVTIVHGMSRPIGALFHIPHGLSNAMLLKNCLEYIADGAYSQFAELAREIGVSDTAGNHKQATENFIKAVDDLCRLCEVPTLQEYGINKTEYFNSIEKMANDAIASGSPANTRKNISTTDVVQIYNQLWK